MTDMQQSVKIRKDQGIFSRWAPLLWVGRQQKPISGYFSKGNIKVVQQIANWEVSCAEAICLQENSWPKQKVIANIAWIFIMGVALSCLKFKFSSAMRSSHEFRNNMSSKRLICCKCHNECYPLSNKQKIWFNQVKIKNIRIK